MGGTYLACRRVLHLERDLRRPVWTILHLPRARLEFVPWRDRSSKTCAKITQRRRSSVADGIQDRAGSKAKRRQAVQDDASKTSPGAHARVCTHTLEVRKGTVQMGRGKGPAHRCGAGCSLPKDDILGPARAMSCLARPSPAHGPAGWTRAAVGKRRCARSASL